MSQWKDDPPKVSISSQRVNCAWKSPSPCASSWGPASQHTVLLAWARCPQPPLNSHIGCSKRSCGFRLGPCEREGLSPSWRQRGPAEGCRGPLQGRPPGMPRDAPTFTEPGPRQETFLLQGRSSYLAGVAQLQTPWGLYKVWRLLLRRIINPTGTKAGRTGSGSRGQRWRKARRAGEAGPSPREEGPAGSREPRPFVPSSQRCGQRITASGHPLPASLTNENSWDCIANLNL